MSSIGRLGEDMKNRLSIGCFIGAIISQSAFAGVIDDCQQDSRSPTRIQACTEIIKTSSFTPTEKASAYVSRGEAHADAGADRQALDDFSAALRLKKDNPSAFAGRARAKFALGNFSGSIADYNQAIHLSPTYADFYVQRGHVYTVSNRPDPAIRDFAEALRLVPKNWSALNERGIANAQKGALVTAQNKFDLAQTYYKAALEDYTAAIAIVAHPVFYANRGHLLESEGKTDDAIKDFQQALLRDPSLTDAKRSLERLGGKEAIPSDVDKHVQEGLALTEKNCSGCHAIGAAGVSTLKDATVFQNIFQKHQLYDLRRPVTQAILASHQAMPQFKVSSHDVDTIVAYINSISTGR